MSLVQIRERLKSVDKALSELNRALMTAGSELANADRMIDSVMGTGSVNGRARRKARNAVVVDGGEVIPKVGSASKAIIAKLPVRRGRPKKDVAETGNPGTEAEV